MTDLTSFAINLAREAGQLIVDYRSLETVKREFKDGLEMVTGADLKADQLIRKGIEETFPDHLLLSEESSPDLGSLESIDEPVWIVDPIDGTVN